MHAVERDEACAQLGAAAQLEGGHVEGDTDAAERTGRQVPQHLVRRAVRAREAAPAHQWLLAVAAERLGEHTTPGGHEAARHLGARKGGRGGGVGGEEGARQLAGEQGGVVARGARRGKTQLMQLRWLAPQIEHRLRQG